MGESAQAFLDRGTVRPCARGEIRVETEAGQGSSVTYVVRG